MIVGSPYSIVAIDPSDNKDRRIIVQLPPEAKRAHLEDVGNCSPRHPAVDRMHKWILGGMTWTTVSNVLEVRAFGFGRELNNYPTIFIVGWVNRNYGIWRSDDHAQSWVKIGDFPLGSLDAVTTIDGDKNVYGTVYLGFGGSGYAYGSLTK